MEIDGPDQALAMVSKGSERRAVFSTNANTCSSRSHCILSLTLRMEDEVHAGRTRVKSSTFHLVDLAGSERQRMSRSSGVRLREAVSINKSLSALGNVIMALAEPWARPWARHVPYRDSKLTFLLRDAVSISPPL